MLSFMKTSSERFQGNLRPVTALTRERAKSSCHATASDRIVLPAVEYSHVVSFFFPPDQEA